MMSVLDWILNKLSQLYYNLHRGSAQVNSYLQTRTKRRRTEKSRTTAKKKNVYPRW
jgi:hypothetical protein